MEKVRHTIRRCRGPGISLFACLFPRREPIFLVIEVAGWLSASPVHNLDLPARPLDPARQATVWATHVASGHRAGTDRGPGTGHRADVRREA
ncbi:hypothetical protein ACFO1B_07445 [Dactylosporangium siamense]|uniref:hypothetical protein n=1 Tax=Dactylosporangium siamense TaxID=685454 RepID=UPI0019457E2F|nr:hypothetical protein [Dactylosporangium siamense]